MRIQGERKMSLRDFMMILITWMKRLLELTFACAHFKILVD